MSRNPSAIVAATIHRLGGVYRDPSRVSTDATSLLSSHVGENLVPKVESLVQNDGSQTPSVMVLSGTVAISYKGSTYNIPVDIYLPPPYPTRPPVAYVRPVATMEIKHNHKHVDQSGMVYMPYLNQWRQHSSNLIEMTIGMISIFSADPPVFAKRNPPPPDIQTAVAVPVGASRQNPPPPAYEDVAEATVVSMSLDTLSSDAQRRRHAEEQEAEIRQQQREVDEANAAAAVVRRAEEEEKRRTLHAREELTAQLQAYLSEYYNNVRFSIAASLKEQTQLNQGADYVEQHVEDLRKRRNVVKKHLEQAEEAQATMQSLVDKVEAARSDQNQQEENDPDKMVVTTDIHSQQLLDLSAKNAALSDCMYFLDKALVKGTIPLDVHLKRIRDLAKKQFLTRAHLLKIAAVKSGQAGQSSF